MTGCFLCGMGKIEGMQTTQYCISDIQDALHRLKIDTLHELGLSGRGIKIAVCDSGIRSTHPLLEGRITKKIQIAFGELEDNAGHGSHVAGILSQTAPKSEIFNIKVLDDNTNGTFADIMTGIETAADMGADVINLSLGSYAKTCIIDNIMCQLVDNIAFERNIAVVCAAGNGGPGISPTIPAGAYGSIAVGSCNDNLTTSNWSSRGPFCGMKYPDCAAIGADIYSAWVNGSVCESHSGTSMATPIVSGLIALLIEAKGRRLTRGEIEYILKNGCIKV
mgnify:CR=1 FL=1